MSAETVEALSKSIADYLETHRNYDSWSKRKCAEEAVRVCLEEAAAAVSRHTRQADTASGAEQ